SRLHAKLHKEARCYRSGPTEPAAAMDEHVRAGSQDGTQFLAGRGPRSLELFVGRRHVYNRQMEPRHPAVRYLLAEMRNAQLGKFLLLYQSYDRDRSPGADRVEIKGKIAIPLTGHGVPVALARAKCDPNPPEQGTGRDGCNLQWVTD